MSASSPVLAGTSTSSAAYSQCAKPLVAYDFPESFGSRQDDLLLNCLALSTDRQSADQSRQVLAKALSSWQPCVVYWLIR